MHNGILKTNPNGSETLHSVYLRIPSQSRTRVPSETSLRPSTIMFARVKLILSLLLRLGLTFMMMQFEQNFVQTDISYWIMLALVGKEAVQLFC